MLLAFAVISPVFSTVSPLVPDETNKFLRLVVTLSVSCLWRACSLIFLNAVFSSWSSLFFLSLSLSLPKSGAPDYFLCFFFFFFGSFGGALNVPVVICQNSLAFLKYLSYFYMSYLGKISLYPSILLANFLVSNLTLS